MHHVNGMSVVLGCVSLLIIVISRKIAPKFPMVVVVMVAGVLLTKYASIEQYGVRMLADVKNGLPSFRLPDPGRVNMTQSSRKRTYRGSGGDGRNTAF